MKGANMLQHLHSAHEPNISEQQYPYMLVYGKYEALPCSLPWSHLVWITCELLFNHGLQHFFFVPYFSVDTITVGLVFTLIECAILKQDMPLV